MRHFFLIWFDTFTMVPTLAILQSNKQIYLMKRILALPKLLFSLKCSLGHFAYNNITDLDFSSFYALAHKGQMSSTDSLEREESKEMTKEMHEDLGIEVCVTTIAPQDQLQLTHSQRLANSTRNQRKGGR